MSKLWIKSVIVLGVCLALGANPVLSNITIYAPDDVTFEYGDPVDLGDPEVVWLDDNGIPYNDDNPYSGYYTVSNDDISPAPYPLGMTSITWLVNAFDDESNFLYGDDAMQIVEIIDTTAPILTLQYDFVTIETANAGGATSEEFDIGIAYAYDLADPYSSITNDAPAGPYLPGVYMINWWACDASGNQSSALQEVTVLYTGATTPIPAPGALLLGSIGIGTVGWLRRRKAL